MRNIGKKKKEILRKIVFFIALIVFIGSGYKLYTIWKEYNDNSNVYKEVRQYAPEFVTDDSGKTKFVFDPVDFEELLKINKDLKAWIKVPGTKVDYPVVQTDNNDYYLKHNFYKESNAGGAIFIASEINKPFEERNTILHGHHMRDGSMFASLENFKDEDFLKENGEIYIATKQGVLEYQIFSIYVETANVEPYKYSFASDEEYLAFLNGLKQKSFYNVGDIKFTKEDKIITLSTCTYEVNDGRLLVHGILKK